MARLKSKKVPKLKNLNGFKTKKPESVKTLKKSNCDKTPIVTNSKTKIVTKLKNSNCDKTQNLEL